MVIEPACATTMRPVVICSIGKLSSYVMIWNEVVGVFVDGFCRFYIVKAMKPWVGTESSREGKPPVSITSFGNAELIGATVTAELIL